jgi:DNA-directed RNA polymerase specialized sigma24 family protein
MKPPADKPMYRQMVGALLAQASVRHRLEAFADARAGSVVDPDDVLSEALARVMNPKQSPWDPSSGKPFIEHVGSVINGLAINERRRARVRNEVVDSNLAEGDLAVDPDPLPDEDVATREGRARIEIVRLRLQAELEQRDPVAAGVYRQVVAGLESATEQAAAAGCSVADVYEAHRRIKTRGQQILATVMKEEASGMRERRRAGGG